MEHKQEQKVGRKCITCICQIGSFEFPMRLTGTEYTNFLNMKLPHLLEDIPLIFRINQWLQHDGAPLHFSRNVQGILSRMYPNRWSERGGPRHWPARSPDLYLLDFSYGGT
jgi:hypothetical protein